MASIEEKRDAYVAEANEIKRKYEETGKARNEAQETMNNLLDQFKDKNSRINELNDLIKEKEDNEACPMDNAA